MNVLAPTVTKPHYLLELESISLRSTDGDLLESTPAWVQKSLLETPFVVVRRATSADGMIPVGVRGSGREQRFAAFISSDTVKRIITPYDLLDKYRQALSTTSIKMHAGCLRSSHSDVTTERSLEDDSQERGAQPSRLHITCGALENLATLVE